MSTARRNMTGRLVPLRSVEAGDSRVGGTPSERVALVAVLSANLWVLSQQPLPVYDRAGIPVRLVPRQANRR